MRRLQELAARCGRTMEALGTAGAVLSSITLMLMVALVLADIFARNLLGRSLNFTGEIVGYGVAAITFGALSYSLQKNVLIRVSLLAGFARRHPLVDRCLQAFALVSTTIIVWFAAVYFWDSVQRHLRRGTLSETSAEVPMWIPEGIMLAGLLLFVLQLIVSLINLAVGNRDHIGGSLAATEDSETDTVVT